MTACIDYHPVSENEQKQAINLWEKIFTRPPPGFFPRYYSSAAPLYRFGDTLAAWCNGLLVSTVHICRLTFRNGDQTYLCGGIACVATLPEFRERGISRHLLEKAVDKMKNEDFDISMLNSVRNSHYENIGFEKHSFSKRALIDLKENMDDVSSSSKFYWKIAHTDDEMTNIYAKQPGPFQLNRSRDYCEGWLNWSWQQNKAILFVIPEQGYIVLSRNNAVCDDGIYYVSEWQAINRETEEQLLKQASYKAQQLQSKQIRLASTPIFVNQEWIETNLGRIVTIAEDPTTMILNINLSKKQYQKIKSLFTTGETTMWPADYF